MTEEKKKPTTKKTIQGLAIILFFIVIIGAMCTGGGEEKPAKQVKQEKPAKQVKQEKPKTAVERVKLEVGEVLPNSKIKVNYEPSLKHVTVTKLPDDHWDDTAMVQTGVSIYIKLGQKLFGSTDVDMLTVLLQADFVDKYGKKSVDRAIELRVPKEEFLKYEWKNLEYTPVYITVKQAAFLFYIHPGVAEKLNYESIKYSPIAD